MKIALLILLTFTSLASAQIGILDTPLVSAPVTSSSGVSSNGLVGQWLFDGNALDYSVNGNNGTLASTASPTPILPALSEGYLTVSASGGQNQYVYVTNAAAFNGTNTFTYSIWFSRADSNHFDPLFIQWDSTSAGRQLAIQITDNSFTNAVMVSLPGITNFLFSSPIIDPHLHLMTLTKSSTTWSLYMDGMLSQSTTLTNIQELSASNMWIGASFPNGSSYGNLSLMDARVYSRTLSATEVQTLWNQGSASMQPYHYVTQQQIQYTVVQKNALGLHTWTDGNLGIVTNGASYGILGALGSDVIGDTFPALTLGTLDGIAATVASTSISIVTNLGSSNVDYRAGGLMINIGGNTNVMLVHQEKWPGGNPSLFWASLAVAVSTNLTNWADCGTIITPHAPYSSGNTVAIEMGGGAFVTNGGYIYCYYNVSNGNYNAPTNAQIAVARCSWSSFVTACCATNTPTFNKYSGGVWTQAGVGGNEAPLAMQNNVSAVWWHLGYDPVNQIYRMVLDSQLSTVNNLRVMWSSDGLTWYGNGQLSTFGNVIYPTIFSPQTPSIGMLGTTNYLFATTSYDSGGTRWDTATLDRYTLNFQPTNDPTLVAQYKFNGTTWDNALNGYDATNVNGVGYANYTNGENGVFSHAISLDGSTQAASCPALMFYNHAQTAGTFCCWVKMTSLNGGYATYELGNSVNNFAFGLPATSSDTLHLYIGSNTDNPGTKNNFVANTWYHIAATWNGTTVVIYVNGAADSTYTRSNTPNSNPSLYATTQIGRYWLGSSSFGGYVAGFMDDARIYNRALSGAEIAAIYSAGAL